MKQLRRILRKPIVDCDRTRRYQGTIDLYIDHLRETWDLPRGLCGTAGLVLPHESRPDYWELPEAERAEMTSPEIQQVYQASTSRSGTHHLAVAAFAWHSPLSRHHRNPDLVRFCENGAEFFTRALRPDGTPALYDLNGLDWSHGWDLEGVVYALALLWDEIQPETRERILGQLRRSGRRFLEMGDSGTHGNQGCVQALGLFLYGHLLDWPDAVQAADRRWAGLVRNVLDDSGQVIEQYGPCMHYSYTSFIYAWLNAFLRDGDGQEERIARCLRWFRYRHTENLDPFPGPSSRAYQPDLGSHAVDLIPACEHLSARDPMFQHLADRIWARIEGAGGGGHGASPLMWALLACPGPLEPTPKQEADWNRAFESYYERIQLLGRSPLKYLLVKRRYQTSLNVRDFLPFSGIQTWAWGEEPPIIHPTRLAPSTTQAWGLDTARQGVSYSWGLFGAGAMVPDFKFRLAEMPGAPSYALSRYDQLWRLTLFTEVSTVILEWGHHGPRRTFWTLNRLAPAAPRIEKGVVHFAGRRARLYSTVPRPQVHEREDPDSSGALRVLEYACGESAAAFAFSDESFAFGPGIPPDGRALVFTDSSGHYEVTLPDRLLSGPNPGQCSISTGELFWKIRVIHSAELRP